MSIIFERTITNHCSNLEHEKLVRDEISSLTNYGFEIIRIRRIEKKKFFIFGSNYTIIEYRIPKRK